MKIRKKMEKKLCIRNKRIIFFFVAQVILAFFVTIEVRSQVSDQQFIQGNKALTVYKDVPLLTASDKYAIRVKSALTNDQWVNVFVHKSTNRAKELPQNQIVGGNRLNYHYQYFTADWSHNYGNIEMSPNTPVDVEISLVNGFQIDKKAVYKAAAHPASKASKQPVVINGKIYFTIDNPCQITIDVNGQMDDHHAEINPIGPPPVSDGSQSYPIHTLSLFANPILQRPVLTDPNIVFVEPGVKPSSNLGVKSILYFKPGVHNIGRNFTIFANKTYYIPGDAIVYGTFANTGGSGANIKLYGSGTISGIKINHPLYDPEYTAPANTTGDKTWKLIWSVNCSNFKVEGLSLMDTPKHTMNLYAAGSNKIETVCSWLKIVTWRSNGDGIGTADVINDCFLRTGDDCSYLKGYERKRIVFWRDVHAAGFHMANMSNSAIVAEDCDVIYNRSRDVIGDNGAIFDQRGGGVNGLESVNLEVNNFRSEDPLANMRFFNLSSGTSGSSYKGLVFKNINIESISIKQLIEGRAGAPWGEGITWDNITFKGVLLTKANFNTYFDVGPFVDVNKMIFKNSSLGTAENNLPLDRAITIYPNPVTNTLNVNSKEKSIDKIQIIDSTGKIVFTDNKLKLEKSIDISKLSSGLYFVKVHSTDTIYTEKFIKK